MLLFLSVAVAISVGVAMTGGGEGGAVEYEGDIAIFTLFVDAFELGEHGAFEQSGADDEDGAVYVAVNNLCVGYNLDRRTVDEDVVVVGTQL